MFCWDSGILNLTVTVSCNGVFYLQEVYLKRAWLLAGKLLKTELLKFSAMRSIISAVSQDHKYLSR